MPHSLSDWEARHRETPAADSAPAEVLRELLPLLATGRALDLACGSGRNALFLAQQGWQVTAVDWSAAALDKLREKAAETGVRSCEATSWEDVHHKGEPGVICLRANLETVILPETCFSLVLNVNYLQRGLFSQMERALVPGGILLFQTYTTTQLAFEGGPRNPDFLLTPGELRTAFPGCHTLFYRELRARKGIATLLARKSAKAPGGAA